MKIKIYNIPIRFSVKMIPVSRRTFKEAASSSFKREDHQNKHDHTLTVLFISSSMKSQQQQVYI
ncbi:hypothetical protein ES319_D07G031000v1 [Gossypium barbadense]|uniref:Uncharacterized protein n=2 Tax=Gossypium TaxID=3633 RepID=A0A5J5QLT9_GOSBA|nr:hypothetical protein ES319_D07G031000v1 [Gossypium barbadense]TYG60009.1 hypothetical protein ES288_D07G032900v1 [Gossypium darwinii]